MDKAIRDLYEPLIRRVTLIGGDLTTTEATRMLDTLMREVAERMRAENFDWYEKAADGAIAARDHLADMIDP